MFDYNKETLYLEQAFYYNHSKETTSNNNCTVFHPCSLLRAAEVMVQ